MRKDLVFGGGLKISALSWRLCTRIR
jgi:hypothetical protein